MYIFHFKSYAVFASRSMSCYQGSTKSWLRYKQTFTSNQKIMLKSTDRKNNFWERRLGILKYDHPYHGFRWKRRTVVFLEVYA